MISGAFRILRTALHAMRRNVMRSILTTLGIVIGVAAVIAMMEIGEGSSRLVQNTLSSMGANTLIIFPGAAATGGISFGVGSSMTLTPQDAEAIARECPAIRWVSPVVRGRGQPQLVYGNRNWVPMQVTGATPEYQQVQNWTKLSDGEFFTDRDVRNSSKVCVLGTTVAKNLFETENPIGKEIRISNVSFKVVGVLAPKGANMMGFDQDDVVIAPWTAIKYRVSGSSAASGSSSSSSSDTSGTVNSLNNLYPSKKVALYPDISAVQAANNPMPVRFANVDQIVVSAVSSDQITPAMKQITQLLRERHHLRGEDVDDFNIRDMSQMIEMLAATARTMTMLLLIVAAISLVVGGVGIMNIMLVSVTERTREIGLRMAVGARSGHILYQFLVESVLLCLAGGAIGILLGRGASILVTKFAGWSTQMSVAAMVISVSVSVLVGVVFGFYPAWKASRLDPIEALRYE